MRRVHDIAADAILCADRCEMSRQQGTRNQSAQVQGVCRLRALAAPDAQAEHSGTGYTRRSDAMHCCTECPECPCTTLTPLTHTHAHTRVARGRYHHVYKAPHVELLISYTSLILVTLNKVKRDRVFHETRDIPIQETRFSSLQLHQTIFRVNV